LSQLDIVELPRVSVERTLGSVLKAALRVAIQRIEEGAFDALVVHCDGLGDLIVNRIRKVPTVCFCHTPLRPVFDRYYRLRVLEQYGGLRRLPFDIFSAVFKAVDRRMWARYSHIFFNSRETETRAEQGGLLRGKTGRYEVLHPGIDWGAHQPVWRYEPYFLLPGRIMWTKNIETAIKAFLIFKDSDQRNFRLVVAGSLDSKSESYFRDLRLLVAGRDDVEFLISPSDRVLWDLYANCYAVVFPAFNEDWGIVPLEANVYGKPVIATDCGGPRESQLDGHTGFLVDPEPQAFAQAMKRLAGDRDLVQKIGRFARENAQQYDWSLFVNRIDTVLEHLAERKADVIDEKIR